MPRAYLREDGTLEGIYEGPEEHCPHRGRPAATLPPDGRMAWDGSAWTWPLERLRERCLLEVNRIRDHALKSAPCPLAGGRGMALDDMALTRLDRARRLAEAALVAGGGRNWPSWLALGGWQMADGSSLPLPRPEDLVRLADWANGEWNRLHDVAFAHADEIRKARDADALAIYDTGTGWKAGNMARPVAGPDWPA